MSLGLGFALLVTIPVAGIVLLITLVGLPLGILTLILYAVGLYLCSIPVAAYVGQRVLDFARLAGRSILIWSFLVGTVLLWLVFLIPWFGSLLKLLVVIAGLGTITLTTASQWQKARATATQPGVKEPPPTISGIE